MSEYAVYVLLAWIFSLVVLYFLLQTAIESSTKDVRENIKMQTLLKIEEMRMKGICEDLLKELVKASKKPN